jgi:hypothetical protein
MSSRARQAFDKNARDVDRLLEIHTTLGGSGVGRRHQLEVLNKSSLVLLTAIWEAYCEDVAAEALEHLIKHSGSPDALPKEIKQLVAKELKAESHELAVWQLSADGWKNVLKSRVVKLREQRNRQFNTPKSAGVDELFVKAIGLEGVSEGWQWKGMSVGNAREKLDELVDRRGAIAHRGSGANKCYKAEVESYFAHVKRLVGKTGGRVNAFSRKTTGTALW